MALVFATVIIAQKTKIVAHSRVVDTPMVGINVEITKKKGYALHTTQKLMLFGQVATIVEHAVVITRNWIVKLAVTHGLIVTIQKESVFYEPFSPVMMTNFVRKSISSCGLMLLLL